MRLLVGSSRKESVVTPIAVRDATSETALGITIPKFQGAGTGGYTQGATYATIVVEPCTGLFPSHENTWYINCLAQSCSGAIADAKPGSKFRNQYL